MTADGQLNIIHAIFIEGDFEKKSLLKSRLFFTQSPGRLCKKQRLDFRRRHMVPELAAAFYVQLPFDCIGKNRGRAG